MADLKIFPHDQKFLKDFKREKDRISKFIKNVEIHHIGSTAVPGLGGKGMIDIMLGINNWKELDGIIEKLKTMGFSHIHPKENKRVFLSKEGFTKLGDTHIHIVKKGGEIYKDLLSFRDCLISDKKESKRYFNLKLKWLKEFKGDRVKYTKGKEGYVKDVLKRMRKN
ncbi:GrpB family protein [bacterium]|nr:MAG: GrpB family protein [bacterium]